MKKIIAIAMLFAAIAVNAQPTLSVVGVSGSELTLKVTGATGTYTVEESGSLNSPDWHQILYSVKLDTNTVAGNGGLAQYGAFHWDAAAHYLNPDNSEHVGGYTNSSYALAFDYFRGGWAVAGDLGDFYSATYYEFNSTGGNDAAGIASGWSNGSFSFADSGLIVVTAETPVAFFRIKLD